jgi:hypothetical protein
MTNKQKKEKKLTFLNHLLAPTFLAQNPKNKEVNLVWTNLCILKKNSLLSDPQKAQNLNI